MNLQGLGEQGTGDEGASAPGRGPEEAASAPGPEEVRLAGVRDLWTPGLAQCGQTWSHPREEVFSPGVGTWRPRCLGAYVRPVVVFLEPRAKP